MKHFSIVLIAASALLYTTKSSAASPKPLPGNLIVNIKQHKVAATFSLQIANLQQHQTTITFYNAVGETLHFKQIENSNGIRIKYLVGEFPDGLYKLEIDWNHQVKIWKVHKHKGFLQFEFEGKRKKEGCWLIPTEKPDPQE